MSTSVSSQHCETRQRFPSDAGAPFQCRTVPTTRKAKSGGLALLLLAACTAAVAGETPDSGWPPFLFPRSTFSEDVVVIVERLWLAPTLTRTVRGRPARAPLEMFAALLDSPEVTAAAARFLHLARYEVEPIDVDRYRATDNDGARGTWHVLARSPTRRVVLSRGEHAGSLLGRISGTALTVVEVASIGGGVEPIVTARVHIENPVAAALARLLITVFGRVADRKMIEGVTVTSRVAEWALEQPQEFCDWLAQEPLPPGSRQRLLTVVPECR